MYYKLNRETLEYKAIKNPMRNLTLYAMILTLWFIVTVNQSCNSVRIIESEKTLIDTTYVERDFSPRHAFLYDKIQSRDRDAFVLAVRSAAKRLGRPYEELMMLFYMECGMTTIRATAKNTTHPFQDGTYAYGIFQITPQCRKFMGVSFDQVQKMDEFQQLDLFVRYIKKTNKPIKSFSDLYLVNYLPNYVGKPDYTSIKKYQESNPQLGATIGEFRHNVNKKYNYFRKQWRN